MTTPKPVNEASVGLVGDDSSVNTTDTSIVTDVNVVKTETRLNQERPIVPKDIDAGRSRELLTIPNIATMLMSQHDKISGMLKVAQQEQLKNDLIDARTSEHNLTIEPYNDWNVDVFSNEKVSYMPIVNKIPQIVKFKKTKTIDVNKEVMSTIMGDYGGQIPALRKSVELFYSGTDRIRYYVSTESTPNKIEYDPEQLYKSTLKLESYYVTGDDSLNIDAQQSRTDAFSAMLEVILKLRTQGRVFIQNINTAKIGDYGIINSGPLTLLSGKNIPIEMPEHILLGIYSHTIDWFVKSVESIVPYEEVIFGESPNNTERAASQNAKKSSYYATSVDHVFATLHHIAMLEHTDKKVNAHVYAQDVSLFQMPGSSIRVVGDLEVDLYEQYRPDEEDSNRYVLMFILSPNFRLSQYHYLEEQITKIKGIRVITASDRLRTVSPNIDPLNTATVVDESLLQLTRGYQLKHFYQMMVMERCHRFIEPNIIIRSSYTTFQDAIFSLLSIGTDALCFPNMFWSNIHLYSVSIYRAWQFLDQEEFQKIMARGYTPEDSHVTQLTKQDLLDGRVPRIFSDNPNSFPKRIRQFLKSIEPVGFVEHPPIYNASWSPIIDTDKAFYNPFVKQKRPRLGSAVLTPFYDRFLSMTFVLKELAKNYGRVEAQSRNVITPVTNKLTLLTEWAKVFGSVCHYELSVIYSCLARGPEIISTTYRGEAKPNVKNFIGIGSTKKQFQGIPSLDRNSSVFPGIGLWGMMSILGDQLTTTGEIKLAETNAFSFEDPSLRYNRYVEIVKNTKNIAESIGIMSYILDSDSNDNPDLKFLMDVFGSSIKAGVANKILEWLLNGISVAKLMYGELADRDTPVFPDQRLYKPRPCEMGYDGTILPYKDSDSKFFKQPLTLLNKYALKTLEVSTATIASEEGPLHRYLRDFIYAKTPFENLSPDNRHPEPEIQLDYIPTDPQVAELDTQIFGYDLIGNETRVYVRINDRKWYGIYEQDFPKRVRINIKNPTEVLHDHWNLLELAIENSEWQLYFEGVIYMTRVIPLTHDVAKKYVLNSKLILESFKKFKYGEVTILEFVDTRIDILNNRMDVFPAGYIQYVCATSPVDRNLVVRGIQGIYQSNNYQPPDKRMWVIGRDVTNTIPTTKSGLPKYKLPLVNFNNYVKVYTSNVELEAKPKIVYLPPRGDQV